MDDQIVRKYQSLQSSAKERSLPFKMSLRKIRSLLVAKKCYFTGIEFSETDPDLKRSIDRMDSTKGYIDDNVVPCIARFNNLKGNISYRELIFLLKGFKKFAKTRKLDLTVLSSTKMKYEKQKQNVRTENSQIKQTS